ncbi:MULTISPECIES: efflux RND transporter periplasmic adaptor subunit [unclassified Rhizobium]|uniref:efflux RND transporter periplasmic adaptor subunit n=1 Tax=unclassified Rhizobium TaxID=2613769 RepID=UPI000EA875E5|nr:MULTISPECIES: efflux RND transporter periplasmic adaptor subunit [unclassified Rhizobium]AYG68496.1 efflux RND transporter periplasmic adaptor subunit [Rhizobium sp. CCGE531]AYG74879.1 efflux RND transporter periplasmic adaptor subunit [Rhizobium sp. CCGE532]
MKTILVIAWLGASAVALSSCEKQAESETKPKNVEAVVAKVTPVVENNAITGEVSARVESDLSFRVSGRIVERLVDVGTSVKAGQVLARMDAEEQKADLDVATANLQSALAQQTQAQLAFDRQQNLFKTQVTTRAALDQAQETLLTAQGSVKSAQAQLDTAQDALSYTELRADADGVITARNAEVGQVAQAAQLVFTLAHDGPRDAVFNVFESLYLGRNLENQVAVSPLSAPSHRMEASVREISPTIDASTGTIRVKVGLEAAPDMQLGAPVVGLFRSTARDAIELPWSAMASKSGKPAVWIIDPASSNVSLRQIDVSGYETGRFAVRTGVSPGEIVVVDGTKFLRSGQAVTYDKGAAK